MTGLDHGAPVQRMWQKMKTYIKSIKTYKSSRSLNF